MRRIRKPTSLLVILLFSLLLLLSGTVLWAQYGKPTTQKASTQPSISFDAALVNAAQKSPKKAATVEVKVTGIELVDPDKVSEKPQAGQGHLHYQLDNGPIVATTSPKLSYHGLTPGPHNITVSLAANDHTALGPQKTLQVTIP